MTSSPGKAAEHCPERARAAAVGGILINAARPVVEHTEGAILGKPRCFGGSRRRAGEEAQPALPTRFQ